MSDLLLVAQSEVDTGDTAWMLVATAMVLMMTPALGLFYAGLVRSKNTLNTFMMCVAALAVATVLWAAVGYSLAFDGGGDLIGGFGHAFLNDVGFEPREGTTIPHLLFMAFQATFCIITVALVSGAVNRKSVPFIPAASNIYDYANVESAQDGVFDDYLAPETTDDANIATRADWTDAWGRITA